MTSENKATVHHLKILRPFADGIHFGRRKLEIRENDRTYQTGDILRFTCIDVEGNQVYHMINILQYRITNMISGCGLKNGYVALGIEEIPEDITMDLINQRLDQKEV